MSASRSRKTLIVGVWLLALVLAILIVIRARYSADLSAFLPRAPTATQRLLVEQLNDGPASRLVLIGIEGVDPMLRASLSHSLATQLRQSADFGFVSNGETLEADTRFVFEHRYQLSPAVNAARFSAAGLRAALQDTLAQLSSPTGLLLKSLVPQDPTGETMRILAQMQGMAQPHSIDGVWSSANGQRALLVARTRAAGSDTDAQEAAIAAIHTRFDTLARASGVASQARLLVSGAGVFAVDARATIKREALRLSLISMTLIVLLLLFVYRSIAALLLGLLPVVSGALAGVAAVALGFGVVYGLTLGFGITLIGESVDYSIYLFIQSLRVPETSGPAPAAALLRTDSSGWIESFWPTIRLGLLTSICGFASLLPSGFSGLAQLGLYSICGLLSAALVTRFVLPLLLPARLGVRDPAAFGIRIASSLHQLRRYRVVLLMLPAVATVILYVHRDGLWNRDLAALSPAPARMQALDAQLRADLGTADVRHVVVISAADQQAALQAAERAGPVLRQLTMAGVIGGFESSARYLPSLRTQQRRLDALPSRAALDAALDRATAGLPLSAARLQPFVRDVEAARSAAALTPVALAGTSLQVGFDSLMINAAGSWRALLPLRPPAAGIGADSIDLARVQQALTQAGITRSTMLDLKVESDALYSSYLADAVRLSLLGLCAITLLLLVTLRSALRIARVMIPLLLAVLCVAAGFMLAGKPLNLLHLVGMLLIVAVGSNYALFFDRRRTHDDPVEQHRMLASLLVANAATVMGFGVLAFSTVPVLQALGATVAPGAFLALLFAGLLAPASD